MNYDEVREGYAVTLAGNPEVPLTVVCVTPYEIHMGYFDNQGRYATVVLPKSAIKALVYKGRLVDNDFPRYSCSKGEDGCVCGGDTRDVRAQCDNWKPDR